jgi:hypothetical protein
LWLALWSLKIHWHIKMCLLKVMMVFTNLSHSPITYFQLKAEILGWCVIK